ncbi:tetratricopeptide repeat protein [Aureibacter tunicatorum]|uniref:Tetratricopeptide (TPR) repeat protein n=1 Tax=Aureibacter tunicatorum TaxID=866807 RepID=A0AAE3XQ94_9BACT|nr:multiheme c-type cytochrome [Aureibacter tunicatorum]MDR6240635.1 tetratricopeptide (TPR) repeat protein [Aureibacter tunicatorum]BDD06504.1 hypothetical protein AUTU_39870 [Aureibacter tunicatorum]
MRNTSKYIQLVRVLGVVASLFLPLYLVVKSNIGDDHALKKVQKATFTGSKSCIECHQSEYDDWLTSDHYKAMAEATDESVLGDFNNITFEAQGNTHRFFKKDGKFMVHTDGAEGDMEDFEIKYVFGYNPLQQYLVEFPGGRLQTLALTWDTENKRWYHMADHVYADQEINHDDWLHWTNQAQNWNGMCADCHSTNLEKNYNHKTDTYNTTWSEINVSCESCHGPASEHLKWATLPEYAKEDIPNHGLSVKTSGIDHIEFVNNCVRCHSRRASIQDFDHHAKSIYDHVIPNSPEDPTWHIDGQIKEEDYVHASFTQSKMHMKGVQCNDCHNVHSGKLIYGNDEKQYNRLCAQCHIPDIYDTPEHHFHKTEGMDGNALTSEAGIKMEVGSGALCVNCHMHGQNYMGVDYRRDHSFRIPRPDLTIKHEVPNACNQCHTEESPQWAESHVTEWYGKRRRFHFADAFSGARNEDETSVERLKNIAGDELYPMNIRSLAIQHLGTYFQDSLKTVVDDYIGHLAPGMRIATLKSNQIQSQEDIHRLLPLLNDETKAVRTETARLLSSIGEHNIPSEYKKNYNNAKDEYEQVLIYNADFPMGKFNLGNFYNNQGKNELAIDYYLKALEQDKKMHFVKLNLAHIYHRLGRNDHAKQQFEDYIYHEPKDAQAIYNYALFLSEMEAYDEALTILEKSYQIDTNIPRVAHNLAMMYDYKGDKKKAEGYLKKEINLMNDFNSKIGLLNFYLSNSKEKQAINMIKEMIKDYPEEAQELKKAFQQLEGW